MKRGEEKKAKLPGLSIGIPFALLVACLYFTGRVSDGLREVLIAASVSMAVFTGVQIVFGWVVYLRRFSLRTLAIFVTLFCVYFGAWEATKSRGVTDTATHMTMDMQDDRYAAWVCTYVQK